MQLIPDQFRAALLCVACDIPASRKVCGFTGHHSKMGCNKSNKAFGVGGIGIPNDYSVFENCTLTNIVEHKKHVEAALAQTTQKLRIYIYIYVYVYNDTISCEDQIYCV